MKYIIYTDGAYSQMNDEGAYAFVILTELNNEVKRFAKKITHETNNRAELKVHENTVRQRLARVAELIGSDWQEARFLDVQLGLRIWSLSQPTDRS